MLSCTLTHFCVSVWDSYPYKVSHVCCRVRCDFLFGKEKETSLNKDCIYKGNKDKKDFECFDPFIFEVSSSFCFCFFLSLMLVIFKDFITLVVVLPILSLYFSSDVIFINNLH